MSLAWPVCDGVNVTGDKPVRAEAITPLFEREEVAIYKQMSLFDKFLDELLYVPVLKYRRHGRRSHPGITYRNQILHVAQYHRRPIRNMCHRRVAARWRCKSPLSTVFREYAITTLIGWSARCSQGSGAHPNMGELPVICIVDGPNMSCRRCTVFCLVCRAYALTSPFAKL